MTKVLSHIIDPITSIYDTVAMPTAGQPEILGTPVIFDEISTPKRNEQFTCLFKYFCVII